MKTTPEPINLKSAACSRAAPAPGTSASSSVHTASLGSAPARRAASAACPRSHRPATQPRRRSRHAPGGEEDHPTVRQRLWDGAHLLHVFHLLQFCLDDMDSVRAVHTYSSTEGAWADRAGAWLNGGWRDAKEPRSQVLQHRGAATEPPPSRSTPASSTMCRRAASLLLAL